MSSTINSLCLYKLGPWWSWDWVRIYPTELSVAWLLLTKMAASVRIAWTRRETAYKWGIRGRWQYSSLPVLYLQSRLDVGSRGSTANTTSHTCQECNSARGQVIWLSIILFVYWAFKYPLSDLKNVKIREIMSYFIRIFVISRIETWNS